MTDEGFAERLFKLRILNFIFPSGKANFICNNLLNDIAKNGNSYFLFGKCDVVDNCCCGFGHRDLFVDLKKELIAVINELIVSENINIFLTGGMGDFDEQFSEAVRTCKAHNENVKLIIVKPYFSNELNKNKKYYETFYDDILIPIELAGCYYKSAITKRNRWIVEQSQIVLSGVNRDFGGAYDTINYAKKAGKRIIEIRKNLKIESL